MLQYCIKQILTNINKNILHVLSIKLRDKLYFSFSIPTPVFPHFYYMLGANLGLLLYGEVSVMLQNYVSTEQRLGAAPASAQSDQSLRCTWDQALAHKA